MKTALQVVLAACAGLALTACGPQVHITQKQMESMKGHGQEWVRNAIGGPYVMTNAGASIWWDYNGIAMPDGSKDGTCQIIFVHDVAKQVKC